MTDAVGKQWVRESEESISKFPDNMAGEFEKWKQIISPNPLLTSVALFSAARVYRNRCGIHGAIGIMH